MKPFHEPDQGKEDEEDADEHPGGDGGHALHVGGVGGDDVEDVDEHEEEGDEHGHPTGDHLRGDQETHLGHDKYNWLPFFCCFFCSPYFGNFATDPGHHDEESRGQVVDVEVLQNMPGQPHLDTWGREW